MDSSLRYPLLSLLFFLFLLSITLQLYTFTLSPNEELEHFMKRNLKYVGILVYLNTQLRSSFPDLTAPTQKTYI